MKGYQLAPFGVRMEPRLKEWLTERAQQNFRSLNAEIVFRLQSSRDKECEAANEKQVA
ncbi:Arc family DNA-binding protein [Cupriavidus necator]|uniref:Arc family DNA-binding protein n=1 Tax=Cupriavidus necator TaxID=106590 RepID=UPI003ECFF35A